MTRVERNLNELAYHADPALSASGAKRLLLPGCPALFKHDRDNGGRPNKRAFDVGHAAHAAVLGTGLEVEVVNKVTRDKQVVPADDYTTKSAQEHRDAIYASGKVPLLEREALHVEEMAQALRRHELAAKLLDPDHGTPEVSVFWHDDVHGIDRRARFDWLPNPTDNGLMLLPDYKSTVCAEPRAFSRSVWSFGYDMQAVFYADAAFAAGLATDVDFVFIAQETTAPYLVTVHRLDHDAQRIGRARVDEACRLFRECTDTDTWPGYTDAADVQYVGPPAWLADTYLEDVTF